MKKVQIMVVGKQETTVNRIENTLKAFPDWHVKTFTDKEAAISFYQQGFQDIVLFAGELDAPDITAMKNIFSFQDPDIVLLDEVAPEQLTDTIKQAVRQRERALKPGISFSDDALKNARFNINFA